MSEEIILTDVDAEEIQDRLLLSTVQKIKKLSAIPGKDRVEKVEFESVGFTAIVEKGLHKEGDLVVFTKYDTVVADIPPFDWMKDMKFRVKPKSFTIKDEYDSVVGKIYSQGIVVKMSAIQEYFNDNPESDGYWGGDAVIDASKLQEGDDLTIALGTRKYIVQVAGSGSSFGTMKSKGTFPTHIVSKTDEDNLASKIKYLERFKGKHVVARLKMEGSSFTAFMDPVAFMSEPPVYELNVCTRNNNLAEAEGNKFWEAANGNHLKEKLKSDPMAIIQAELMGPGIQKNKLQLTQPDIYVFTVTDMHTKYRYEDGEMEGFCARHGLKIAPKIAEWNDFQLNFDELQEIADKLEYLPGVPAEGMVIRTYVPEMDGRGNWISVKIINRNYSL